MQRFTGLKGEKFEEVAKRLGVAIKRKNKKKIVSGRPYKVGGAREHLLLILLYYRTYVSHAFLASLFQVDETTVLRSIRRVESHLKRILKVKMKRTISLEKLKIMILDATEQVIERPENQREYYSGKKHAHTIKTEIVTDEQGKILRVSKPYPGCIHDFEIRKNEGPLPPVPILADSGYQGLQNIHSAAVLLPKKKPKGGCLTDSERARNEKLARCRIRVEHVFAHLKKWQILASRYRGFLQNYARTFQIVAGLYNLSIAG